MKSILIAITCQNTFLSLELRNWSEAEKASWMKSILIAITCQNTFLSLELRNWSEAEKAS